MLELLKRIPVHLQGPVSVVVGRLDGRTCLAVAGKTAPALQSGSCSPDTPGAAAVHVLDLVHHRRQRWNHVHVFGEMAARSRMAESTL